MLRVLSIYPSISILPIRFSLRTRPTHCFPQSTPTPYTTLRTRRMTGVELGLAVAGLVGTAAMPMIESVVSHYRKRQKKKSTRKRAMPRSSGGRGDSVASARTRYHCCDTTRPARDYDDEWREADGVRWVKGRSCAEACRGADEVRWRNCAEVCREADEAHWVEGRNCAEACRVIAEGDERRIDSSQVYVPPPPRQTSKSLFQQLDRVPDSQREWDSRDGASERGGRRGRGGRGWSGEAGGRDGRGGRVRSGQADRAGGRGGPEVWHDRGNQHGEEVDEVGHCCCHFDEGCCLG